MKILRAIKKAIRNAVLVDLVASTVKPIWLPVNPYTTKSKQWSRMPEARCEIGPHIKMNVPRTRSQLKSTPQCRSSKVYKMASF